MKWLTLILNVLSGIDIKKWLTHIVAVILGTVFILAFIALVICVLQWRGKCEQRAIYHLAGPLFKYSMNVTVTFFALAFLQTSAFFLVFSPLWKRNWFRIAFAVAMISYPTVFWVLMRMSERMGP